MTAEKFRENVVFLTLAQAKLREQVEELSGKMNSRLDAVDPAFKTIAEALPKAADGDEDRRRRPEGPAGRRKRCRPSSAR